MDRGRRGWTIVMGLGGALLAGRLATAQVAPSAAKAFVPTRTVVGRPVQLGLTLANPGASPMTGVTLTDNLPSGLAVAASPSVSSTCDGAVSAAPGATTVSVTGVTLAGAGSCEVFLAVSPTTAGDLVNSDCTIALGPDPPVACSPATLTVLERPTLAKAFDPTAVAVGGVATLTFTVASPAAAIPGPTFIEVGFLDDLPPGLVVASPSSLTGSCLDPLAPGVVNVASVSATAGGSSIEMFSLALDAGANCAVSVAVVATAIGAKVNLTGPLGYLYDDGNEPTYWTSPGASATLTVGGPDLAISKFHVGDFPRGSSGQLFTIEVANLGTLPTSGLVTVTDTLPVGLVATALGGSGWTNCTATPVAGPAALACQRTDPLAPAASYPPLVVTVSVAPAAPATVVNVASVEGGGDTSPGNGTATDPVTIVGGAASEIPTLGAGALALLASLLAAAACVALRRA